MREVLVDLGDYSNMRPPMYSGRNEGVKTGSEIGFNKFDFDSINNVVINIPQDTALISRGFFYGMIGDIAIKLGKDQFNKIFKFTGPEFLVEDLWKMSEDLYAPNGF